MPQAFARRPAAALDITTVVAESSMSRLRIRRCDGVGVRRTVCSVLMTGTVGASPKSST